MTSATGAPCRPPTQVGPCPDLLAPPPLKPTPRLARILAAERTLDTVLWQLVASVAAPGYTIHTIVALTLASLRWLEAQDAVQGAIQVRAGGVVAGRGGAAVMHVQSRRKASLDLDRQLMKPNILRAGDTVGDVHAEIQICKNSRRRGGGHLSIPRGRTDCDLGVVGELRGCMWVGVVPAHLTCEG